MCNIRVAVVAIFLTLLFFVPDASAANGEVLSHQKISSTEGGFTGTLDDEDLVGASATSLGDLDGDGVTDLAVGARGDDDGGWFRGAVWILFLNSDGTVKAHQKISDTEGGFTGTLENHDSFGTSAASLGDLDGDGVTDLAVGAYLDDDGGSGRGAVWILFLNSDGTVKAHQKISDTEGGFTGTLDNNDYFGISAASLDDLDGDGVTDLAVGATGDDDGPANPGAVWILFLNSDGTVKAHQKISNTEGGFTGTLDDGDSFGRSAASLGDLDGDGVTDLAVGAWNDDDGGAYHGAEWIFFLNSDGTVEAHQKISDTEGGFTGTLDDDDRFGTSAASLGDLDGDGMTDLAVGATGDDDGGSGRGSVWVLFLDGVPDNVISADLTCVPLSGTVPLDAVFTATLNNNLSEFPRRIAARINLTLANGLQYSNWKAGHTNVPADDFYETNWAQTIPALASVIGDNIFTLIAEDVTPSPYNQPPYPSAGDTDTASCTVTGIAP